MMVNHWLIMVIIGDNGGFHSHGGTPIYGWFVRKIPLKWMMTGGTPISGNLQIYKHAKSYT